MKHGFHPVGHHFNSNQFWRPELDTQWKQYIYFRSKIERYFMHYDCKTCLKTVVPFLVTKIRLLASMKLQKKTNIYSKYKLFDS